MTTMTITIDDRARLVMAVLAASDWPNEEQKQLTHAVHPHAKQTRHFVQKYKYHEAVRGVNQALLNGVTVAELFSTAMRCAWPTFEPLEPLPHLLKIERWARSLADFEHDTNIVESFWQKHTDDWQTAVAALTAIFHGGQTTAFLKKLTRSAIGPQLVIMPNLVYPALTPVLASNQDAIYLLLPPLKAVGESPPWPYDEDPAQVVATTCQELAVRLMADHLAALDKGHRELFRHAATTLCLEAHFDAAEAQAYLLRAKKEHHLPDLPWVVERLLLYLDGDLPELVGIFT